MDTYSGYLVAIPFKKANQTNTIKTLEIINWYYDVLLQIQSENNKREMLKLMVDIISLFSLYLVYALM